MVTFWLLAFDDLELSAANASAVAVSVDSGAADLRANVDAAIEGAAETAGLVATVCLFGHFLAPGLFGLTFIFYRV